jgi:hypothetical protein
MTNEAMGENQAKINKAMNELITMLGDGGFTVVVRSTEYSNRKKIVLKDRHTGQTSNSAFEFEA